MSEFLLLKSHVVGLVDLLCVCLLVEILPFIGPIIRESHFPYITLCNSCDSIYSKTICVRNVIIESCCWPRGLVVHVPFWWRSFLQGPIKGESPI